MAKLMEALLERVGYHDGETVFGALYDIRRRQDSRAGRSGGSGGGSGRSSSRMNGDRQVVLVSHSKGGYFALKFLNRSPMARRWRHVKHFVMASTGAGGFLLMQTLASGFTPLSSPKVFDRDTPRKNYTVQVHDGSCGLPAFEVTLYETRALPVAMKFGAPVVPTMEKLVYWDDNFSLATDVVHGDGLVNWDLLEIFIFFNPNN
uniref:Uncharacterized protein n=1 Tax=Leersia perrieri TaxID=77586 RepID=A0A0D9X794_9ORYZ